MQFREHTLDNGLEIVAECNDQAYSTGLGFFVRAGSRDESDEVAGVSHFLEHMMFKGTPRRTADDVNREFDEMGAHYNAFTTEEGTVYYAAVLPEYQSAAVDLLGDIMRPSLRKEDFDTEKKVIIEEIRMYEDQPPFGADDKCKAVFFGRHPLGRSVLGTPETITDLSVEQMRSYFESRYSPQNIVLVGAGRIDFEQLVTDAERLCGGWQRIEAERQVAPAMPHAEFQCLGKDISAQEYVMELAAGPAAEDPDRYAAKILATVLGDDSGSRLYWELVDTGYAEHASLGHYDYQGAGLFLTYMSCLPENTSDNLQRVLDLYRKAEAEGFSEAELEQAKRKINSRVVLSSERPRGRLFSVGSNWIQRAEYRTVQDDLRAVEGVSVDDLERLLKQYPLTFNTTVAIGPKRDIVAPR